MTRHVLVVFSEPTEGMEAEYNDWYDNCHLPEVLQAPGVIAAERFRLADDSEGFPGRYLAIYELETDDPAAIFSDLEARAADGRMRMSQAIDLDRATAAAFTSITARVKARD